MLFSTMSSFGQIRDFKDIPKDILEKLDKMGVDASPLLNCYEGVYLNAIFKDCLKGFDFTGKKVGFIHSGAKSDKQEYFSNVKGRYHSNSTPVGQKVRLDRITTARYHGQWDLNTGGRPSFVINRYDASYYPGFGGASNVQPINPPISRFNYSFLFWR